MQDQKKPKPDLKALRQERADWVARASARVKQQNRDLKGIRQCLAGGPATAPALAQETGLAPHLVLWYLAGLKKYGQVVEDAKEGSFFRYALVEQAKPVDDQPAQNGEVGS